MIKKGNFDTHIIKIKEYYHKYGNIPSFETLTKLLGLKSKGSIHKIFNKLIELGMIIKDGHKFMPTKRFLSIPVFESVKAGLPDEANEDIHEDLNIQSYLIDDPINDIMIKVKGDSMKDAGIMDGDIVIVDKQKKAKIGDIIVAIVDGDFTLKYLMKDDKSFYLKAANPKYKDIYPKIGLNIFGVVRGSFRKY